MRANIYCVYSVFALLFVICTVAFLRRWSETLAGVSIGNYSLGIIVDVAGLIILALLGLFPIIVLVRFLIIAIFFARFTMMQAIGFVLSVNCLATLIVTAPAGWNLVPAVALAYVILRSLRFLSRQDPESENYTPEFIREPSAYETDSGTAGPQGPGPASRLQPSCTCDLTP